MPSEVISCPYCSARVSLPAAGTPGQRVACPRCGDTFPYFAPERDEDAPDSVSAVPESPTRVPEPLPPARAHLPNWVIAVTVLAGMAVLAAVSLVFALSTVLARREHDWHLAKGETLSVPVAARLGLGVYLLSLVGTVLWDWNRRRRLIAAGEQPQALRGRWGTPILGAVVVVGVGLVLLSIQTRPSRHLPEAQPGGALPVQAVPPAQLAALGYLPEDTNLVVGFQVAEALREPAGKELLASSDGLGKGTRDRFKEWTGLELEDLDHAVLGLRLDEQTIPQVLLVVRTLRPYDIQRVVETLKAIRLTPAGGRTVYRFGIENPLRQNGYMWCPDERTLVIGLKAKDLERVPPVPRTGSDHLPGPVQTFLQERLRSATPLWVVGHVEDWKKTALHTFLSVWIMDDWAVLSNVRTFGLWLQGEGGITLNGAFACANDGAARALQQYLLAEENGEKKVLRSLGLPGEAQGLARGWSRTMKVEQTGPWVTLQARTGTEIPRTK
jgi:hypothetical protein